MGKRILVIGSGGRETALVRNLHRDETIEIIYCAPGNDSLPLIGERARSVPGVVLNDHSALIQFAQEARIDLTIVGPEKPLVDGIVDNFTAVGLRIVGPTRAAARLEGSKAFCKNFLREHNIRTPGFEVFNNATRAERYIRCQIPPIVVKADGLAGGEGVIVAQKRNDAVEAARSLLEKHSTVVIEKFVRGCECSFTALTDGTSLLPLLPVMDYKRALTFDQGPNEAI